MTVSSQVDNQSLIEDVFINNDCLENVYVTNVQGGQFNQTKSYGYFNSNGSDFPFAEGLVLTTGKLTSVPGPNSSLSSDDSNNWGGDTDLENYTSTSNTTNATVIEFDFKPYTNHVEFRYLFASEEYRDSNASTCKYSDVFVFLIKPKNGGTYQNIAVIPGTSTPVKVTTVHPAIPNGCPAKNETYFGQFNTSNAPINFNGRTAVLTAKADVTPGVLYHIKLVIADQKNYQYDSAVFLEAGSFQASANLGEDLIGVCPGDTATLRPQTQGTQPTYYKWYRLNGANNATLINQGATQDSLKVTANGTYKVEVTYSGNCTATDQIEVRYADFSNIRDVALSFCTFNTNGKVDVNLPIYNNVFTAAQSDIEVAGYYHSAQAAEAGNNQGKITTPEAYLADANEEIFVRLETTTPFNCPKVIKVTITTGETDFPPLSYKLCPEPDGILTFDLTSKADEIETLYGSSLDGLRYYPSAEDAINSSNTIRQPSNFQINQTDLPKSIYARLDTYYGCQAIFEIQLSLYDSPKIDPRYQPAHLCVGMSNAVQVLPGILGDTTQYKYQWNTGETTAGITVNQPGIYQVEISKANPVNQDTIWCSITREIEVKLSEKPQLSYELLGEPGNYRVKIKAEGLGDYVYALDNAPFQKDSIYRVMPGTHHIYAKDKNGCGIAATEIEVIGYMKFFTPNGDGYNDYWHLLEVDRIKSNVESIQIFDRYGKLLTILPAKGEWDGTFHGKPLYETEYWFKVIFKNGNIFTNHFSLIR